MQNTLLPSTGLAEFYRFALLLAGDHEAAERIMAEVLRDAEKRIGDLRDEAQRAAWLAARIRQRCFENGGGRAIAPLASPGSASEESTDPPPAGIALAQHFRGLPEPERSALALFYLDPFTPEQIAQLLGMKLDQLAETLARARTLLQRTLRAAAPTA